MSILEYERCYKPRNPRGVSDLDDADIPVAVAQEEAPTVVATPNPLYYIIDKVNSPYFCCDFHKRTKII